MRRHFTPQPLQLTAAEETLIRVLRCLSERDRAEIVRKLEVAGLLSRDPVAQAGGGR